MPTKNPKKLIVFTPEDLSMMAELRERFGQKTDSGLVRFLIRTTHKRLKEQK